MVYCWRNTPQKMLKWQRRLTPTLFCSFGRQSRRNILVNCQEVLFFCMTMPTLARLNSSRFSSTIFAGMCLDIPRICLLSHPLITICLRTFIDGWEGNDFHWMQKWKRWSITTSKNWTKMFMILAFENYLTTTKNVLPRWLCREVVVNAKILLSWFPTCPIDFWFLQFFWAFLFHQSSYHFLAIKKKFFYKLWQFFEVL